jgi:BASS family bile acid:Na+ symporter
MPAAHWLVTLFPLWAVVAAAAALIWPRHIASLSPAIVPLLGMVMFAMGATLTPADFLRVVQHPRVIAFGTAAQFGIMPLAGWAIGRALGLPPELLAGVVLVGACPGGTASEVITYLARGDVALSVTLTTVSTLLAAVATPALTWLYIGRTVPVPFVPMLLSICGVVLLPVAAGVAINRFLGHRLGRFQAWLPLVSVSAIVVIIAVVVAGNAARAATLVWPVVAAVILHNGLGLSLGYLLPWIYRYPAPVCRTISIEVGMQNSGLAVALATQFFSAAAALPGAVFSVWHNLSGSLLAGWWSRRKTDVGLS